jgi:ABC-type lipoprotein export system ATPase subunit
VGIASPGSLWHRWDPHIHAPGTLHNDCFKSDWKGYNERINGSTPRISALGVTDYFCIGTYRSVKQRLEAGEYPNVGLVFPNVEMRLETHTARNQGINIHLLFSPHDKDHENTIERILSHLEFTTGGPSGRSYRCDENGLTELGRHFNPTLTDPAALKSAGANQFKVSLADLKELFKKEAWLENNCLVAISGGKNDGTSGLQHDDAYTIFRREIERFADIVFSATPGQRQFWLGKQPGTSPQEIERIYGSLKPCMHGSDAHELSKVGAPDQDRFCWLKGELSFETLRQVVMEPERRVWVGDKPPADGGGVASVRNMHVTGASWLQWPNIPINPGLVAVIGSRGSGKSALVEVIAHGAGALTDPDNTTSFLLRAADLLGEAKVELTWGDDNRTSPIRLSHRNTADELWLSEENVRYLSQHFVERMCSGTGVAKELRREIERVVFEATDPSLRMNCGSFAELIDVKREPIDARRNDLRAEIAQLTDAIAADEKLHSNLKELQADQAKKQQQLTNARTELTKLIPKGAEERAKHLATFEGAVTRANERLEKLQRRRTSLGELSNEVAQNRSTGAAVRLSQLARRFEHAGLAESDWKEFELRYRPPVDGILGRETSKADNTIAAVTKGLNPEDLDLADVPLDEWPVESLKIRRDVLKKEVGIDAERLVRYQALQRQISQLEVALSRSGAEIEKALGAPARRQANRELRRNSYRGIFEIFASEELILKELYAPLQQELTGGRGAVGKLSFTVERKVNAEAWVKRGEGLLDLRKASPFRGEGALLGIAQEELIPAWLAGAPGAVTQTVLGFAEKYGKELLSAVPSSVEMTRLAQWRQELSAWLFDTSHIELVYALRYDKVPIEKLSSGTRGIVLLMLYLVLDKSDMRPLIIDQPEENLDPRSVFDELVPHFRDARQRRQIIIVTHNANLVVNTDADQVILAESSPLSGNSGLPRLSYSAGPLENEGIRTAVCNILEGGKKAFEDRAKRYRFRVSIK